MAGGDRKNADTALVVAVAAGLTNKQAAEQVVVKRTPGEFAVKVQY